MATSNPDTQPSPQSSSENRNIIIIGGGIIGSTTAYYLTRHPAYNPSTDKITLLEATTIAGGASGKAGGLLALWAYPKSLVPLSYRLHRELADEHDGARRWGYRQVHCGSVECVGGSYSALNDSNAKRRRVEGKNGAMSGDDEATVQAIEGEGGDDAARVSLQKRSGDAMKKLRAAGVPQDLDWLDSEALKAYDEMGDPSTTAQVHPFQFTTSMAALAREKGVEIRERAVVKSINYTADGKGVESVTYEERRGKSSGVNGTAEEARITTLPATDIIVAAGPWTRSVLPSAPIAGLRAHSVTIRPARPVSAYALFTQIKLPPGFPLAGRGPSNNSSTTSNGESSSDRQKAGRAQFVSPEIYARPFNEVYACGEGDTLIPLPAFSDEVLVDESRCQDVVDHVSAISAELRDGEVTARQACYLPNVEGGGDPLVGFVKSGVKGLLVASGHTCWGIQNGPATGKLMSEFVFEGQARSTDVKALDPRKVLG